MCPSRFTLPTSRVLTPSSSSSVCAHVPAFDSADGSNCCRSFTEGHPIPSADTYRDCLHASAILTEIADHASASAHSTSCEPTLATTTHIDPQADERQGGQHVRRRQRACADQVRPASFSPTPTCRSICRAFLGRTIFVAEPSKPFSADAAAARLARVNSRDPRCRCTTTDAGRAAFLLGVCRARNTDRSACPAFQVWHRLNRRRQHETLVMTTTHPLPSCILTLTSN